MKGADAATFPGPAARFVPAARALIRSVFQQNIPNELSAQAWRMRPLNNDSGD